MQKHFWCNRKFTKENIYVVLCNMLHRCTSMWMCPQSWRIQHLSIDERKVNRCLLHENKSFILTFKEMKPQRSVPKMPYILLQISHIFGQSVPSGKSWCLSSRALLIWSHTMKTNYIEIGLHIKKLNHLEKQVIMRS